MYPLNDKDLDRLSRDAAEHFDVPSGDSGWDHLESRLNKELPVKEKGRRRFFFWLFFVTILAGGSLVYMLSRAPQANTLAAETQEARKEPVTTEKATAQKANEKTTNADQQEKANFSTVDRQSKEQADVVSTDSKKVNANVSAQEARDISPSPAASPAQRKIASTKADKSRSTTSSLQRNDATTTRNSSDAATRNAVTNKKRNQAAGDKPQRDQLATRDNTSAIDQAALDLMKSTMPVIDAQKMYEDGVVKKDIPEPAANPAPAPKQEEKSKLSKWEFGLLTGPDFNNVNFTHSHKAGLNMGVSIGYRISDRWQVNTGLIYTKKWYKVDGKDFHPPKHSYLSYQDILLVTGSCNMFEIPVNVRYDFSVNNKRRWFASTGFSSYIMDKQNYLTDYIASSNGQRYEYPWKEDSNYNHFISNINLSIGYERAIGRNFSIQAEPYFKIPLQGLGYGSMKMNSYGLYITFKYKPSARLKK